MFDTICNLPLSSDLFTQAIHPSEPIVAVGLSGGHVETFRLPPVADDDGSDANEAATASESGFGQIESSWRTRRHKGSCRSLVFSIDGETVYSAGTDGLVKAASTATGQVTSKLAIPRIAPNDALDDPSLLHVLSPQTFLLATDSSALHLFDLRADNGRFSSQTAQQTHHPHDDYVSSLTPLPPTEASTSGFSKQWVTTGGATLAVTDLRRGVLAKSEDQEEELLSSLFVGGLGKRGSSMGEKVLVGGASGVLTLWEKGVWDDQDERIVVDRSPGGGESLDVLAHVPNGVGPGGKVVAVGMGNGLVRFVRVGQNKVIGEVSHDETGEGVAALGFDVGGRMITGGGQVIKVWHEKIAGEEEEEEADETSKRPMDSDDSDDDDDSDADSSDEDTGKTRRKKRKRGKGKDRTGGQHVMKFNLD